MRRRSANSGGDRIINTAADDETDVSRLAMNRLCAGTPTPKCVYYLQLARRYGRAVDHVVVSLPKTETPILYPLAKSSNSLGGKVIKVIGLITSTEE